MTGITDYVGFLKEAKLAVESLNQEKETFGHFRAEELHLQKTLEGEKKGVLDSISLTVKRRQDEMISSYDKQIGIGQEHLKKARTKREKAKNLGIRGRIAEENSALYEHNRELRLRMKTLFQQNHLPSYCSSNLYYSLYFPKSPSEYLALLCALLVCFLVFPGIVYYMLPVHKPWLLILIYFVDVIVFGGIYMLVNNRTKVGCSAVFKEGRMIRDVIDANHKKIRVITNTIKKDSSEDAYHLEEYDDEITRASNELKEITEKKKDALNTFENVTRTIISDEITANSHKKIEQLALRQAKAEQGRKVSEQTVKTKSLEIADRYEPYLGKENLKSERLAELIKIMQDGTAANLTEAVEIYKRNEEI